MHSSCTGSHLSSLKPYLQQVCPSREIETETCVQIIPVKMCVSSEREGNEEEEDEEEKQTKTMKRDCVVVN